MCIIIHKPAGITLEPATYNTCFVGNPDGAGFSYADGGKVVIEKGFFKAGDLLAALEPHLHREIVVHFRWATHGDKNQFNCHPWLIEGCHQGFTFAVHHNGILDWESSDEMSDTGHFVRDFLAPLLRQNPWFLDLEQGIACLEAVIGRGNKLAIQRSDGKVYLVNQEAGEEDLGCWFSNTGYKSWTSLGSRFADLDDEDGWPEDVEEEDEEERLSKIREMTDEQFNELIAFEDRYFDLAVRFAEEQGEDTPATMSDARYLLRTTYKEAFPRDYENLKGDLHALDQEIMDNMHLFV